MKRILSTILLVSFCAVQAVPMKEFSDAISKHDTVVVATLLQQNVLTEQEAFELLNEAEGLLRLHEKTFWKFLDYSLQSKMFISGLASAYILAGFLASEDKLILFTGGLFLSVWSLCSQDKKSASQVHNAYGEAIAVQRLLYKALLDVKYSVKAQA